MSNQAQPKSGLPEGFSYKSIEDSLPRIEPGEMPVSVEAANKEKAKTDALSDKVTDLTEKVDLDPMTGLLNQGAFLDTLPEIIENISEGDSFAIYAFDLDRFKVVNDTLGHPAGNKLLMIVTEALKETFHRGTDTVTHISEEDTRLNNLARTGGDEFAASTLLKAGAVVHERRALDITEETKTQSARANENLEERLRGTDFENIGLRLSVGIAVFRPGDTMESMLARADAAMYEDKYRGRYDHMSDEDRQYLRVSIPIHEKYGERISEGLKTAVYSDAA